MRYDFEKAKAFNRAGFQLLDIQNDPDFCRRDTFFTLLEQARADLYHASRSRCSDVRLDYEALIPKKLKALYDYFPSQQVHINVVRSDWNEIRDRNANVSVPRTTRNPMLKICN